MKLYLVFEYLDFDLAYYMDHVRAIDPELVKSYTLQILKGVHYLHGRRIYHRDLKPQNLLIDMSGKLKICDLGLARVICHPSRSYTQEVITLWYRPPELLLGEEHYDSAVDMWSIGCIIMEMARNKPLFPGSDEMDQLYKIFRVLGTPTLESYPGYFNLPGYSIKIPLWRRQLLSSLYTDVIDPYLLDLVEQMLLYNPARRITAKMSMDHAFVQSINH